MPTVYAIKTGNWSDTTVWNTGSLPTAADDVRSNGFVVTVDGSYSVNSVSNKSETSPVVTAGGYFDLTNGVTLTATNGVTGGFANVGAVRCGLPIGQSATFVGNFKAAVTNAYGILKTGDGTLNIVGNCDNQAGTLYGMVLSGGTVNMTGNLSGGAVGYGFRFDAASILNLTGNVVNLNINLVSTASTVNIVGNVSATSSQSAIQGSNVNSIVTVNGNVTDVNGSRAVATAGKLYLSDTTITYTASSITGQKPLYSSDQIGGNPAPANVRHGIAYGIANEITGTCYVPSPSSVAYNVPVDATVGTAVLTPANVLAALGMSSANLDSQLSGILSKTLNASDTRAALGLASANLDTQLSGIKTKTDTIADPLAKSYVQLEAYDAETAAGLLMKLNVGAPTEPVVVIPAEPPTVDLCTCYLDTSAITGDHRAGISVTFKLSTPLSVCNRVVEAKEVTAKTDETGRIEITLLRTDAIHPDGAVYLVNSEELGIVNRTMTLTTSVFSMTTWLLSLVN